jgi:hypothetical protein
MRLYEYDSMLYQLRFIHYHCTISTEQERLKQEILSIAKEMADLADSINTEQAKQVVKNLEKKPQEEKIK